VRAAKGVCSLLTDLEGKSNRKCSTSRLNSPFILHHSPFTLHPSPFTLHPSPCFFTLHPSSFTLHPSPCFFTLSPRFETYLRRRAAVFRRRLIAPRRSYQSIKPYNLSFDPDALRATFLENEPCRCSCAAAAAILYKL